MTDPITIFRASKGLNTKADPARIYSSKEGITDLAVAGDIDITDTGRISRRKGYTQQISGISAHSLFCDGGDCLFVTGTNLCILNSDYSYDVLTAVHANARMAYVQINDQIYYCNGYQKGIIEDKNVKSWELGEYVGPPTRRHLVDPPIGTKLAYYNGRVFVVQGDVIWYSEPGYFGAFDLARGFLWYPSSIRMVRPVDDGMYISTSTQTFFVSGSNPLEFTQTKVADYPAIQWTDIKLSGRLVFNQDGGKTIVETNGLSAMWMSEQGICYGGPSGNFYNLTFDKIASFPTGLTGSGLVHNGRYVGLINS